MQIINPIQMNDWEIKKFLKIVFAIQFAIWGAIGLDSISLHIPLIRQIIGFIYLTFIPGFIILRILKLHNLGNIETVLYGVGLSLTTLMFTGTLITVAYPLIGISKPISTITLISTISALVFALSAICYVKDENFNNPNYINIKEIINPPTLVLCLIPFLAIFGTHLVNYYHNNILLICLTFIIVAIVVLITFSKLIPKKLYPLAVYIIAISLLFSNSLISSYVYGWDIHFEYYSANLVKLAGLWDPTISGNINAMLSIVMIAPIFSEILNLNLTWVFKIVYPLFFSFLPLALYHIYQKQTDEMTAFLSVFYFMSIFMFYTGMLGLARQMVAELFLALIILTMVVTKINVFSKRILMIIFGAGLITSHYGLSYLFLVFVPFGYIFMSCVLKYKSDTFRIGFLMIYIVLVLTWYMCISSGSAFNQIVHIAQNIFETMHSDILSTTSITIATKASPTITNQLIKELYLVSQFLIIIGYTNVLMCSKKFRFRNEYLTLSIMFIFVLIASTMTSSTGMKIQRLFHIASIVLSPFLVIGSITISRMIYKIRGVALTYKSDKNSLRVVSIFLIIFFIFNNGFVQEITKESPRSISLNQDLYKNLDSTNRNTFFSMYYTDVDICGVGWISKNKNNEMKIYADTARKNLLFSSYGMMPNEYRLYNNTNVKSDYIYLGYPNTHYGLMYGPQLGKYWNIQDISQLLDGKNMIYSSDGSKIYV